MRQKRRILRTYGLWLIDILCIIFTYFLSTKLRFRGIHSYEMNSRTINDLCCLIFVLISTFYSFFVDWTGNFLHRGKFEEFMAVLRYMIILFVSGTMIVFLLNWGQEISRLVFVNFAWMNLVVTYLAHLAFRKFMHTYFRSERQSSKLVVVAQRSLMQATLQELLDHHDGALKIVGAAYVDEVAHDVANASVDGRAEDHSNYSSPEAKAANNNDNSAIAIQGLNSDRINAADGTNNTAGNGISNGISPNCGSPNSGITSDTTNSSGINNGATLTLHVSPNKYGQDEHDETIPIFAGYHNLTEALVQIPFDEVLINAPDKPMVKLQEIVDGFEDMGVDCHYVLRMPERKGALSRMETYKGYDVVTYTMNRHSYKKLMVKRFTDIVGGIVGLVLTGILTVFLAPAIKIESPGPVFFSQVRVGKNGRRFRIWKFRSMYQDAEARLQDLMKDNEMKGLMFKMDNDPRVTKVGRFIRKTSLDEFPQFWNVLKGDMSLVGTRPPTEQEFEQYTEHYRRRLQMTPGLTGMWQVSGRSEIEDFDEVVKLDLYYIDNWSLSLDFKIILQTIGVIFTHKGAK